MTGPDAYRDLPRLLELVGTSGSGESAGAVNVQVVVLVWVVADDVGSDWVVSLNAFLKRHIGIHVSCHVLL